MPFIERFAAARKAGFDAVEFLFPYDYSTLQIQKQLEQNHLTLALFNTAPGDINAGEWLSLIHISSARLALSGKPSSVII